MLGPGSEDVIARLQAEVAFYRARCHDESRIAQAHLADATMWRNAWHDQRDLNIRLADFVNKLLNSRRMWQDKWEWERDRFKLSRAVKEAIAKKSEFTLSSPHQPCTNIVGDTVCAECRDDWPCDDAHVSPWTEAYGDRPFAAVHPE